jgi:hypothetical protein
MHDVEARLLGCDPSKKKLTVSLEELQGRVEVGKSEEEWGRAVQWGGGGIFRNGFQEWNGVKSWKEFTKK